MFARVFVCVCQRRENPIPVFIHEKTVTSNRLTMILVSLLSGHLRRLYRVCGVAGGDSSRDAGQHLRHVSSAQHALPADPAYGSYGPTGRHLETTGLGGLRSQQGAK